MSPQERLNDMLERYGEVCKRTVAAKILSKSPRTINNMIADGRLEAACAGEMVDVRSIARYICCPKQADAEVRLRKLAAKHNSGWAV